MNNVTYLEAVLFIILQVILQFIVVIHQPAYSNAGQGVDIVQRDMKTNKVHAKFKEGELLVKFKAGTSDDVKLKIHERIGSEVIKEFHSIKVQHVRLKKGLSVEEAVRLYQFDPNVEYAEPVGIVKILE
jgi:hypothetical protein